MLENVPKTVGEALQGARAGANKVVSHTPDFAAVPDTIVLSSSAFSDGTPMPARFTEDGAKVSPPLAWRNVPAEALAFVLIVEDPDAPVPEPLVHCILWSLPTGNGSLPEGGLKSAGSPGGDQAFGKNSFLKAEYLPPDPPTGHGVHHYWFQIFAVGRALDLSGTPGRGAVIDAMRGHVLAKGTLVGTYERQ